jgi:outer membrane protein assembly factor BamB
VLREFKGLIPNWGICESVLVDQNRLICTPGGDEGTVVALEAETGKPIWAARVSETDRAGYASAAVAEVGGVRQYVVFTSRGTVGVRADDGRDLWRDDSAANGTANCSSPLVAGDLVFTSSGYGTGGSLVKLAAGSSGVTAKRVYHTNELKSHHGEMVIVDGLIFGSNDPGVFTCLELATGKLKWRSREPGKGSVTFADNRLYIRTEGGTMALVEASGQAYKELGRFDEPHRSSSSAWPHPVVASGRLFLRDQDRLLCYDVRAKK